MSVDRRRQRRAAITGPRTGCMKLRATTVERDADVATTPVVPTEKKEKKKRTAEALEVVVLGLSHHNAKVEVREKLAIPEDNWNEAATALCEYNSISEAAVLSTCNRFELYLAGQNQYELIKVIPPIIIASSWCCTLWYTLSTHILLPYNINAPYLIILFTPINDQLTLWTTYLETLLKPLYNIIQDAINYLE